MQLLVDIYRSSLKEGMYLYLEKGKTVDSIPEELARRFGKGELAMTLLLTPDKTLARASVEKVMAQVQEKGFYLQLPPGPEDYMQSIPNDKLTNKPV